MATYSNTAREVEMPNGDVVVIHNAPTGGENTTSNIKKFKYDDNGHVTESTAADAEDLNLSGYSTPTTGTTDIGTSDDIQTAIGKLDHQSQIDQSNILYGLQTGVKNLFDLKNADITAVTNISIVKTDTSLTVTTTVEKKWSHVSIPMELEAGTYHVLATISNRTADASAITRFIVTSNAGGSSELGGVTFTNNGVIDFQFTTTGGTVYLIPYPNYSATGYNSTFTASEIMVCTKAAWDQEPNVYRQFALPNSDLTGLQAEDRAELIELVDSGAKNLLDFANLQFQAQGGTTYTKTDTDITVTSSSAWAACTYKMSLSAGNYVFSAKISNLSVGSGGSAKICLDTSSDGHGTRAATLDIAQNGTVSKAFTWGGGTLYIMYYPNYTATAITTTFKASENMICTKAAFCISPKFVPYKPTLGVVASLYRKATTATSETSTGLSATIPSTGIYRITASVWDAGVSVKASALTIKHSSGGSDYITSAAEPLSASARNVNCVVLVSFAGGEVVTLYGTWSAASQTSDCELVVEKIG